MDKKDLKELYKKQGYRFLGKNGAVKICSWTKRALLGTGCCYKQKFYNIKSHRCLQITPCLSFCNHNCIFCWRAFPGTKEKMEEWDSPEEIIDKAIENQRLLLNGFGGNKKVDKKMYEEARNPNQVAISLAGEPLLYPEINGLLKEIHNRGMTSFLVTNGTLPEVIEGLNPLPTQLYITVPAPDEEIYRKTCKPGVKDGWERIKRSLDIMEGLKTRRVVRLTLVKGLNFVKPGEYGRLLEGKSDFIEAKAFMSVGFSRRRLDYDRMPKFDDIMEFSDKLAKEIGYKVIDYKKDSRVCLISKEDWEWRKLT